jgi:hypothetical protein
VPQSFPDPDRSSFVAAIGSVRYLVSVEVHVITVRNESSSPYKRKERRRKQFFFEKKNQKTFACLRVTGASANVGL